MKILLLVLSVFLSVLGLSGQTKVSSIENLVDVNPLFIDGDKLQVLKWRDRDYFLTRSGSVLKLSSFEEGVPDIIEIDLGLECGSVSATGFRVYGDELFMSTGLAILQINLQDKEVADIYHFETSDLIGEFSREGDNGLLVTFGGAVNLERLIARVDLISKEITYMQISPSTSISFVGDHIIAVDYDSLRVIAYDLTEGNEITLLNDGVFAIAKSNGGEDGVYFRDQQGALYEIDSNLEITVRCTDVPYGNAQTVSVVGDFLYLYQRSFDPSVSSYYEIFDLAECVLVKSADVAAATRYLPTEYSDTSSLLQVYDELLFFDYTTHDVVRLDLPTPFITPLIVADRFAYAYHITAQDSVLVFSFDLENKTSTGFSTGLTSSIYSTLKFVVHGDDTFSLTGSIDEKHTAVYFDSKFFEIGRYVLTATQNYGLDIHSSRLWSITNGVPYLLHNGNFLQLDGDSLAQFNDLDMKFSSLIYQEDNLFGYSKRNDSVLFTVALRDSVLQERVVEEDMYSDDLVKRGSRVFRVSEGSDLQQEMYPNYSAVEETGAYVLKKIYHQFEDKVLAAIVVGGSTKLALLGDEDFEVIWHGNNTARLQGQYNCWNTDMKTTVFVFNTVQSGSLVLSISDLTEEVLFIKEIPNVQLLNDSERQKHKQWKTLHLGDGNRVINEVLVTDGLELHQFTLSDVERIYGAVVHYANGHIFFVNSDGSFAMDTEGKLSVLSEVAFNRITTDVFYHNAKYYCILDDTYEVKVFAVALDFGGEEEIFRANKSVCRSYSNGYFIETAESERALLAMSTYDFGTELWELNFATEDISLLADMHEEKKSGFKQVEFMLDGELYFTAVEEATNTQLYRLQIGQHQTTATNDEYTPSALLIHPNPTTGLIQLDIPLSSMKLFSSSGVECQVPSVSIDRGSTLDIGPLPKGIYFLTGIDRQGVLRSAKICKL